MDAIPLSFLLIPYGIILLVAVLFLFFNVYHLLKYGFETPGTRLLALFYIGVFILAAGGTGMLLMDFDWSETFSLADLLPSSSGLSNYGL